MFFMVNWYFDIKLLQTAIFVFHEARYTCQVTKPCMHAVLVDTVCTQIFFHCPRPLFSLCSRSPPPQTRRRHPRPQPTTPSCSVLHASLALCSRPLSSGVDMGLLPLGLWPKKSSYLSLIWPNISLLPASQPSKAKGPRQSRRVISWLLPIGVRMCATPPSAGSSVGAVLCRFSLRLSSLLSTLKLEPRHDGPVAAQQMERGTAGDG